MFFRLNNYSNDHLLILSIGEKCLFLEQNIAQRRLAILVGVDVGRALCKFLV
jgi:hypothetical protein